MGEGERFQLGTVGALTLSVVSSVSIVICNKALISSLGFTFGKFLMTVSFFFFGLNGTLIYNIVASFLLFFSLWTVCVVSFNAEFIWIASFSKYLVLETSLRFCGVF